MQSFVIQRVILKGGLEVSQRKLPLSELCAQRCEWSCRLGRKHPDHSRTFPYPQINDTGFEGLMTQFRFCFTDPLERFPSSKRWQQMFWILLEGNDKKRKKFKIQFESGGGFCAFYDARKLSAFSSLYCMFISSSHKNQPLNINLLSFYAPWRTNSPQ